MLIIVIGLFVIGFCGYGYISVFGPDEFVWRDEIREGQELVVKVETFRQENLSPARVLGGSRDTGFGLPEVQLREM